MSVVDVVELSEDDKLAWLRLASGYKTFYRTPTTRQEFDLAWNRLRSGEPYFCRAGVLDRQLVGLVQCVFHASMWSDVVCYLQDLYVCEHARGKGVARTLIEVVAQEARRRHCGRMFWLTHESNDTARALYDKVAQYRGFVRYEYSLTAVDSR